MKRIPSTVVPGTTGSTFAVCHVFQSESRSGSAKCEEILVRSLPNCTSFAEYNVLSLARVPGVGEIEILWNVINSNPPCTRYHGQVEENYR